MHPSRRDITIYRGDTYVHEITFVASDGTTPMPVNGWTWTATVSQYRAAPTPFVVDVSAAAAGVVTIRIEGTVTAGFLSDGFWDIQGVRADVPNPTVWTPLGGRMRFSPDVTP